MSGLNCLNCKCEVGSDEAKIYAQVFLCPDCFRIAERLHQRGEQELKMMMLVLKESIRVAALRGELQFRGMQPEDIPKEDLVSHLARLAAEARKQALPNEVACPAPMTPCVESTPLNALSADGKRKLTYLKARD